MFNYLKSKIIANEFIISKFNIFFSPVFIARRSLLNFLILHSNNIKGKTLDFGCGSKPYESIFIYSTEYIGVDIKYSGHNHTNSKIDFFYDGKKIPFPDQYFDSIVCFEVLEHVFNIDKILQEFMRVLKPGGKVLISVPFVWEEHEIPFDFARYSSYGLVYLLKKNLFQIIKAEKTTSYFLTLCQLFINFIFNNLMPNFKPLRMLLKITLIFPLNFISIFLNHFISDNNKLYLNNVFLIKKPKKINHEKVT